MGRPAGVIEPADLAVVVEQDRVLQLVLLDPEVVLLGHRREGRVDREPDGRLVELLELLVGVLHRLGLVAADDPRALRVDPLEDDGPARVVRQAPLGSRAVHQGEVRRLLTELGFLSLFLAAPQRGRRGRQRHHRGAETDPRHQIRHFLHA